MTSPSGTETIDLAPREILVVLTNDSERRQAQNYFAEARSTSKSRASTSPSPHYPSTTPTSPSSSQGSRTAFSPTMERCPSPPATPSVFAHNPPTGSYLAYNPPKSATTTTTSPPVSVASLSISSQRPLSPSSITSSNTGVTSAGRISTSSVASSLSKVLPLSSKRKSRRPHTSAGPRDSLDVRVGGSVPVPVPMPVPQMGYSNSSSTSTSPHSGHSMKPPRTSASSNGKHSPSLAGTYVRLRGDQMPTPKSTSTRVHSHEDTNTNINPNDAGFKTLNTSFTGLNGIGGPGAMALVWNQHQQRLSGSGSSGRQDEEYGPPNGEERAVVEQDDKSSDLVRAWEEELVRIEKASRRSSRDMLGFWSALGRRKTKGHA